MPQHLPDPKQRDVRPDHLARRGVPQPMRAEFRDPGASARPTDRRGDGPGRDRLIRRFGSQEHLAPVAVRSPAPQIRSDRLADVGRDGHLILQQRVTNLRIRWSSLTRSTRCMGSGLMFCACVATPAGAGMCVTGACWADSRCPRTRRIAARYRLSSR